MPPILLFGDQVEQRYLDLQAIEEKRMTKSSSEIRYELERLVIGQQNAIDEIMPLIQLHSARLNPEGRPVGVVMLMGLTGSGKTHTVEALAEILHGNPKKMLKIDCGEFALEQDSAKFFGANPGYIGHKETDPVFSQKKMKAITSDDCDLQIILFDEIEKSAQSICRAILGIMDKATLTLADNTTVSFQNSLIFFTSNLGSEAMLQSAVSKWGFGSFLTVEAQPDKLKAIGLNAAKKKFNPEFINRIDSFVAYNPLTRESCSAILDHLVSGFVKLVARRLGLKSFSVILTYAAVEKILDEGTSIEYGARELRRVIQKALIIPAANLMEEGMIPPQSVVTLDWSSSYSLSVA